MNSTIFLITRNKGKYLVAKDAFEKLGLNLKRTDSSFPEIQADSSMEIAKKMAKQMHAKLGNWVIREDHSLYLDKLNFPGPYTNYFNKNINEDNLLRIINSINSTSGKMVLSAVLVGNGVCKEFEYSVPIQFSKTPKGDLSIGWDRVLMLKGDKRTFAEYPQSERIKAWQSNFDKIAKYLSKKIVTQ